MHRGRISHQDLVFSYVWEANGKAGFVVRNVHDSPTEIDPGVYALDVGWHLGGSNPEEKHICEFAKTLTVRGFARIMGPGGVNSCVGDSHTDVVVI